jgi:hypothetical protein
MGLKGAKETHPREGFAMTPASKQAGWLLWLLWVAASTIGFALGSTAHGKAGTLLTDATPAVITLTVTIGNYPLVATLPGFLHWLILRNWFPRAGWWVLASGAGSLLGYVVMGWGLGVADTQEGTTFSRFAVPASMAVAGAAVGTLQWVVLRRWISHAGWWVLASSISWVVAEYAYLKLTRASDVHLFLGAAVSGALSGAITGLTLVWLMRTGGQRRRR